MSAPATAAPPTSTGGSAPREPRRRHRNTYAWPARAFSLPAVLLVAVLLYLPFLWTTWISLTEYDGLGSPEWVGLDNYRAMFDDANFLTSLRNTLIWVVGTITVPVALGLLIAMLSHGLRFGAWLRLPFLIPYAISGVAVGIVWVFVLQNGGGLSQVLEALGLPGSDSRWLLDAPMNTVVMIGAAAWQQTGVNALLFVIGLQSIPREPIEAARLDGASGWRMFRHLYWPMLRPLTTVVVGLGLVASLKTFDIVWIMTKGGPGRNSETLAVTMYEETFVNSAYGAGSAIAVFLSAVTFLAAITYLRRQLSTERVV